MNFGVVNCFVVLLSVLEYCVINKCRETMNGRVYGRIGLCNKLVCTNSGRVYDRIRVKIPKLSSSKP